jgi:hypothetical protein
MDYIKPIKNQLDEQMHNQCVAFMLIGTQRETPRYMNFGEFDNDTKVLTIQSTQTSKIFFDIETDFDFIEVDKFWVQFKEYRTEFLIENYPTINPY